MDIKTINSKIEELAKSEKISKALLIELSRSILAYVYSSGDVTPVNRLLRVLTPMNKRTAILFFKHFLSFRFDDLLIEFHKKNKKTFDKKQKLVDVFLADEDNNIFTWAEENVQIEKKDVDWTKRLTSDFTKALEDGLSIEDVMSILQAVIDTTDEDVQVGVEDEPVEDIKVAA